ncbi:CHAT domain-containing protein [Planctomicrobium sp. SH661]|uniref:CHAT domain-containing protein n=1 Tax=Planctomicrobium sp. SH661 TaxID=3448124 RepID=UPI003F5BDCEC
MLPDNEGTFTLAFRDGHIERHRLKDDDVWRRLFNYHDGEPVNLDELEIEDQTPAPAPPIRSLAECLTRLKETNINDRDAIALILSELRQHIDEFNQPTLQASITGVLVDPAVLKQITANQEAVCSGVAPLLKSSDVYVRMWAVPIFHMNCPEEQLADSPLSELKNDPNPDLRARVLRLFHQLPGPVSGEPISQVLLGWHFYHDLHGHFPRNIVASDGKPLLSWRVAILPLIDQKELYEKFHLHEPWDSPHNRQLIPLLPRIYETSGRAPDDFTTRLQAVTGKGTVFGDSVSISQITDGTSNTLCLVESDTGVTWTRPDDFIIPASDISRHLWRRSNGTFSIGIVDGTRKSTEVLEDALFQNLASYAGGEQSLSEQRHELLKKFQQELNSETPKNALNTARQILRLEEKIYGETDDVPLDTIVWLADNSYRLGETALGREYLSLRKDRLAKRYGAEDYRAIEAAMDLQLLDRRLAMTEEQRQAAAQAETVQKEIEEAFSQNDFPAALKLSQQRLKLIETAYGEISPHAIGALRACKEFQARTGDLNGSIATAEQMLKMSRQILGPSHPRTLQDFADYCMLLRNAGQNDRAVELLTGSLDAILRSCEPASAIPLCELLGTDSIRHGQFQRGRHLFGDAVRFCDLHKNPNRAVLLCKTLGVLLTEAGQFDLAKCALFEAVWRADRTETPLEFRSNYEALAALFSSQGMSHLELGLRQTHRQLIEEALPAGRVSVMEYSLSFLNLSQLFLGMGDFPNAERNFANVIAVLKQSDPNAAPPVTVLLGLAQVEQFKKRPDLEEAYLLQIQKILDNPHELPVTLQRRCRRALADLRWRQARIAEAFAEYEKIMALHADPNSVEGLGDRIRAAKLTLESGRSEAALTLARGIESSLAAWKTPPGPDFHVCSDLSELLVLCGDQQAAARWSETALASCQKRFGSDSRLFAESLLKSAWVSFKCGQTDKAAEQAQRALEVSRKILDHSMYVLSSRQQMLLREQMRQSLDLLITVESQRGSDAPAIFTAIYQWKGDAQLRQRNLQDLMQDADIKSFQEQLSSISNRLVRAAKRASAQAPQQEHEHLERQTQDLSDFKELLEQQLSAAQLAYLDTIPRQPLQEFFRSIPEDAVFVDFFAYRNMAAGTHGAPDHLLATIIRPTGKTLVVQLGSLNSIQPEVERWRESFGLGQEGKEAGIKLRNLLWEPLLKHVSDARLILMSPDATLGKLPFNALPGKAPGTYLLQDHRLAAVPVPQLTGSMLSSLNADPGARSLLMLGDIDYDFSIPEQPSSGISSGSLLTSLRGGQQFQSLPGTATELRAIEGLSEKTGKINREGIQVLVQQQATESAFRKLAPGFHILHVATHGYFATSAGSKPAGQDPGAQGQGFSANETIENYHPGLLSGLAMAGANSPDAGGEEDGILTADEIATLPLSNVDLAVLSACETGIGQLTYGDGLIGVQRAFQIAGARSTIASLWKVNDHATQVLMTRFYQNLWDGSHSRLDALRDAQIWMLEHPQEVWSSASAEARGISRVPKKSTSDSTSTQLSPEYWGAFVLSGNWN